MADDILKALTDSYSSVNTNIDNDKQSINQAVGKTVATRRMREYTEELNKIKDIRNAEADRYKELYKAELNAGKYSQKVKADLLKQEISHYTSLYNLNKQLHEKQTALLEAERNVYKSISDKGKITLQNQFELYSLKVKEQELEKQTAEYKIKKFEENVNKVKKGFETIVSHVFKRLDELDNIKVWNNWSKGITDLQTQYETNFTEISGRLGVSSGIDTHNFIGNVLNDVTSNDIYTKGLNFNNEVFPQITEAVKRGFQGEKAEEIGLSTAIDKKIMPWLDTTSETWTNLQYNLSDNLLAQLKGQQLQLQATQEGNRILQNGVVSEITDSLAPTLLNIDANTTDVSTMTGQAQAMANALMDQGYSKQDAVKAVNQVINAYQNPMQALQSNNTADKLYALGGLQGGDIASALTFANNFLQTGVNGNWATSGAFANLGFVTNGLTRNTDWMKDMDVATQAANDYVSTNLQGTYNNKVNNLSEYVTATQQNDNKKQNESVMRVFNDAFGNHLLDVDRMILEEIQNIKSWLLTGLIAGFVTSFGNKIIDKIIGKLGKTALSSTSMGGGGVMGTLPTASTSAFGSSNPILSKLGGGLLTNAGGTTTAGLASIGGIIAGGVIAKKGYDGWKESNEILKNKTSNDIEIENAKKGSNASKVAMAGGIAGSAGLLALGASNPIGWIALAIGGTALAIKKYNDHLAELDDATGRITKNFESAKETIDKENDSRKSQLLAIGENIQSISDTNDKLTYLQKNGIDTSNFKLSEGATTQEKVNEELQKYLDNLIQANEENSDDAKELIDDISAGFKNKFNENVDIVKENLLDSFSKEALAKKYTNADDDKLWEYQKQALKDIGYNDEQIEKMRTHFSDGVMDRKELKGVLDKGAVDGKNIGSWEDLIESGKVNYSDVNYRLRSAGAKDKNGNYIQLMDEDTISNTLGGLADSIVYLTKYRQYGRSKEKETKNVPIEFNQNEYDQHKEAILKASPKAKDLLTEAFSLKGDSNAMSDWPNSLKGYKLGSSYIPNDMLAILHAGERVLTANQNKEYTEELQTGNGSIIVNSIQDVVSAIQNQTKTIIDYLSTMNFNNSSGFKKMSMLPSMGNTKVTL